MKSSLKTLAGESRELVKQRYFHSRSITAIASTVNRMVNSIKVALLRAWWRLATTYKAGTGRITHFFNGDILHVRDIPAALRVKKTRTGAVSIGNWSIAAQRDSDLAIRNLNGSLDESALFSDALS